jgi:protein involved in ribonucleotide reduction
MSQFETDLKRALIQSMEQQSMQYSTSNADDEYMLQTAYMLSLESSEKELSNDYDLALALSLSLNDESSSYVPKPVVRFLNDESSSSVPKPVVRFLNDESSSSVPKPVVRNESLLLAAEKQMNEYRIQSNCRTLREFHNQLGKK